MTTAKAEPKGLHAKLAEVMAEAGRIPKNGKAPQAMGGFEFVQVGDAADAIRKALGERGVSMLPTSVEVIGESEHQTRSGGTMTTQTVRTTWTLTDGETGQTAVIQSLGTGADSGDKFSPKAQTNAMKYALLMGFLLSTGDDPEQQDTSDRQAPVREGTETLELLGNLQKAGTLVAGTASMYKGEWRESPDGWSIGLRLKLDGEDRDIPQVLIKGAIGQALYLAGPEVLGLRVTVRGKLYGVKAPGRSVYYRLVIGDADSDYIETPEWRIPALPSDKPAGLEDPPAVAPGQETAFDLTDEALAPR